MGCKTGWNSNFKEILIPLPVHQTRHNKQLREQNAAYALSFIAIFEILSIRHRPWDFKIHFPDKKPLQLE